MDCDTNLTGLAEVLFPLLIVRYSEIGSLDFVSTDNKIIVLFEKKKKQKPTRRKNRWKFFKILRYVVFITMRRQDGTCIVISRFSVRGLCTLDETK